MDIETILDLATSIVFRHASQIHRAAENPQELFAAAGRVPLDFMNDGWEGQDLRPGKPLGQAYMSISVSAGQAEAP